MAEEKVKMKKKTKEANENIYALDLDFNEDNNVENLDFSSYIDENENTNHIEEIENTDEQDEMEEAEFVLKGYEEQD